jgi:RNA polymerase sigma-70 factor (ECF subfamily)
MGRVVAETRPRLLAAARRIGAPQDAEDAVQAAYLSLVRHRGAPLDAPVMPWLLTAVVRGAYRRKAVLRRELALAERLARPRPGAVDDAAARAVSAEEVARLRALVSRLPARYRDPAVLHLLEGLSIAEVARLSGLGEGTVRTRLHRARRLVRARIDPRVLATLLAAPWAVADAVARERGGPAAGVGAGVKAGTVGLVASLAAAAGVVTGLFAGAPAPSDAEGEARLRALEGEVAAAREDVRALLARRTEAGLAAAPAGAEAADAARPAGTAPPSPPATPPAGPPAPAADAAARTAPLVAFDGARLEAWGVEWDDVGRRLHEMVPLVARLAREWGRPQQDPSLADLVGRLSELNGPLVRHAIRASEALKTPAGVNGAFVHPWFMANALAATLAAAGRPLSPSQVEAVRAAGEASLREDARRAAARPADALFHEALLEESAARGAFFEAVRAALTRDQRAVLEARGAEGRVQGDLFSPALLWTGIVKPVAVASDAAWREEVRTSLGLSRLPEADRAAADRALDAALAAHPGALEEAPSDEASQAGFLPLAWVEESARRRVALVRRLLGEGVLDAATGAAIRRSAELPVPVRAPAPR